MLRKTSLSHLSYEETVPTCHCHKDRNGHPTSSGLDHSGECSHILSCFSHKRTGGPGTPRYACLYVSACVLRSTILLLLRRGTNFPRIVELPRFSRLIIVLCGVYSVVRIVSAVNSRRRRALNSLWLEKDGSFAPLNLL